MSSSTLFAFNSNKNRLALLTRKQAYCSLFEYSNNAFRSTSHIILSHALIARHSSNKLYKKYKEIEKYKELAMAANRLEYVKIPFFLETHS